MQFIKWAVILLMPVFFLPETSQASSRKEETGNTGCTLRSHASPAECFRNLLLTDFLTTPGDLPENGTHNTYDKKHFPRLLFFSGYGKTPPPGVKPSFRRQHTSHPFAGTGAFYVYLLQKIVI